jgi:UDP-N-acetylmuramoyl-L-alanyl-D-glutamate--2,6-diaminopimelate ligase
MNLKELAKAIQITASKGELDIEIAQLHFDSRKVEPGSIFFATKGTFVDGHDYMEDAADRGAAAIIAERWPEKLSDQVVYLKVENSAEALGIIAGRFYGQPSRNLKLIGVTGTNGKTTTVSLLHELFIGLGYKAGLLSTVHNKVGHTVLPSTHTTPDAVTINRLLAEMVESGCDYVFMEVSSHAVHQRRIAGLHFTGAVFSNISHDHLDYHKTFKAYIAAKKMFFDNLPKSAFALINIDDKRGRVMVQNTLAGVYTYSLREIADFRARIIDNSMTGLQLEVNGREVFTRLIGDFNAYNLLAVYGTAILLQQEEVEVLTAISQLQSVEGRFDYQLGPQGQVGIVDYAHTPDALEKVLMTIRQFRAGNSQIITIVGCGGDRDKAKRPVMAKVACDYSDQVILTSDNPRTEDPEAILRDMEAGIPPYSRNKVLTIVNRKEAIRTGARLATAEDILLVAGKGHERYQEINGLKHPFDDKAILNEALNG